MLTGFLQSASPDPFLLQAQVQGLYDEMSQAALQFGTESDIDDFYGALYTSDWSMTDAKGQQHTWPEVRQQEVAALSQPKSDALRQAIQKFSLVPGGASVIVLRTDVRNIVDNEGKYGPVGKAHVIAEQTLFHDEWVGEGEHWKLKSRQQEGPTKILVDKTDEG
jgi:hypothetical protein